MQRDSLEQSVQDEPRTRACKLLAPLRMLRVFQQLCKCTSRRQRTKGLSIVFDSTPRAVRLRDVLFEVESRPRSYPATELTNLGNARHNGSARTPYRPYVCTSKVILALSRPLQRKSCLSTRTAHQRRSVRWVEGKRSIRAFADRFRRILWLTNEFAHPRCVQELRVLGLDEQRTA